jgi:hypothetical protein
LHPKFEAVTRDADVIHQQLPHRGT